jgi:nicotinate-nucleotide pyrophosphorylase (carboxylating)
MRSAALFDLDHTVLTSDTGMSWMRFQRRRGELSTAGLARAIGWSLLYKAAVLDLEALATKLTAELAGDPEAPMIAAAAAWYAQDVVPMIAPAARHAIAAHRAAGDVVALATGATQYAAESVARGLGIAHTLCSRLEVVDGRFTGKLAAMCFGVHKVTLVEAFAPRRRHRPRALDVLLRQLQRSAAARAGRHAGGGQPRRAAVAPRPRPRLAHRAVAMIAGSGHAAAMSESPLRGLALLPHVRRLIELALDEDLGRGDVTTAATVGHADTQAVAVMNARVPLTVFGLDVAAAVFALVDPRIAVTCHVVDGARVAGGRTPLLTARGPAAEILMAERTALNFAQRLSGVATLASRYADEVAGTPCRVVDTRKTTPGYRVLEKAAVAAGGCGNHRFDLGSGILIKDNHIVACGGVRAAVERARARAPHPLRIECEVTDERELTDALDAGAEVVLLDNMTPAQVERAAAIAHARGVKVEVSGGVTLATLRAYALAGADLISVGALTHSAPAVDIGLDFEPS